jgi:glycosyltransferase involved in cell wall biosynthesis
MSDALYPDSFPIDISLVIPLFNEAESIPELVNQIFDSINKSSLAARFGHAPTLEIIFINDGSNDGSDKVIKNLIAAHNEIRLISFRRNYGKSAGLAAGFAEAKGKYVFTMDADLQDSPYEIEPMIAKLDEGYDLVSGWKQKRYDPISKTIPSKFFNFVTRRISGVKIHDFNCGLKAYRNEVVKSVQVYGEMHRYIPVLAKWNGFRVSELVVEHRARKYGYSKFGLSRFFNGFLDLLTVTFITKYTKRPMHFFGMIGIVCFLFGFIISATLTYDKYVRNEFVSNRPLLLLGMLLIILGVQFFLGGLLGEMITKTYYQNDSYLVKEKINFD